MTAGSDACVTVAKGGVGESGASSLLTHTIGGSTDKLIVLRNVDTSLCPNTGAVAILTVNGVPAAFGDVTRKGSSIQTDAPPGSNVAAIVHSIPVFNGVVCIRLGELSVHLDECELVEDSIKAEWRGGVSATSNLATRDWYAWNDLMPPKPDVFHIVGEVQVPNPGVDVLLAPRTPQGINPKILLLDLILTQKPDLWPQMVVWKQARYDKVNAFYESVEIFVDNDLIATVPVDVVQ